MVLSVGDKIKLVKEIVGFNYIGEVFTITNFYNGRIAFCGNMGVGFMTLEECAEYFEKVEKETKEEKWSDWKTYKNERMIKYRTKGEVIEMRDFHFKKSVFSKPCEEDSFDLETGLEICFIKMKIFYNSQVLKEVIDMAKKEVGAITKALKEELKNF